jgi:alpha-D-ribose 1-methylphosphonate 5-triphosphate synthase subunit PhnH
MSQMQNIEVPTPELVYSDFNTPKGFQAIFGAMSQPGKRIYVDNEIDIPEDLNFAAAASCLILLGAESLFWTDLSWNSASIGWLQRHCRCTIVSEPCLATCALVTRPAVMPPLNHFRIGENECPANAATLIIQVDDIHLSKGMKLSGPGIKKVARLSPKGIPQDFWKQWQALSGSYPLGVDIFFACEDAVVALPRTAQIN